MADVVQDAINQTSLRQRVTDMSIGDQLPFALKHYGALKVFISGKLKTKHPERDYRTKKETKNGRFIISRRKDFLSE